MLNHILPVIAATAIAVASARIINPSVVRVEIRGSHVESTTTGAPAPDHQLVVDRDESARTCAITYVLY